METKKFKPFDKVLVKALTDEKWTPDLYSYYDDIKNLHWCIGGGWASDDAILPYEGNEHLVGTTDEPDEEVRLEVGEYIMASDFIGGMEEGECSFGRFIGIKDESFIQESYQYTGGLTYKYAIRFKDFNPDDMEETRKHILCVKNGRIVKYKNYENK